MVLLEGAARRFFTVAARARSARAFHPQGVVLRARAVIEEPASALGEAVGVGEHEAVVRFSRGIGLPESWPDILGAAVRIEPADRGPVDLLMTTVGHSRPGSIVLRPVMRWASHPYSTLMPYDTPHGTRILGLVPQEDEMADASIATLVARLAARPYLLDLVERTGSGPWQAVGRLVVTAERLPERRYDFDPMLHATDTVHPVRFLRSVREAAYVGSRRGRGAQSIHP